MDSKEHYLSGIKAAASMARSFGEDENYTPDEAGRKALMRLAEFLYKFAKQSDQGAV